MRKLSLIESLGDKRFIIKECMITNKVRFGIMVVMVVNLSMKCLRVSFSPYSMYFFGGRFSVYHFAIYELGSEIGTHCFKRVH